MSVLCGWASIDENGKAKGGKAGDQTGREVKTGAWYSFGQTQCLRWKDRTLAEKYAKIIKALCNGNLVGYDQDERVTLHNALKRLAWDYTKLTEKVETDCSELVGAAVNATVKKETITSSVYTGNLKSVLMASGLFEEMTGSKYMSGSEYLMTGDILNAPGHHVISVLEDGPKAGVTSKAEGTSLVAEPTLKRGSTGSQVKKLQRNLNKLGYTDSNKAELEVDGSFGASTLEALKKFQKKNGLTVDGVYGSASYAKMKTLIK